MRFKRAIVTSIVCVVAGMPVLGVMIRAMNSSEVQAQNRLEEGVVYEESEAATPPAFDPYSTVSDSRFGPPVRDEAVPVPNKHPTNSIGSAFVPQRTPSPSQPVTIDVKNGPQMVGTIRNLQAIEFESVFGTVSIALSTIAGIRVTDELSQPATVIFQNGDSLTGKLLNDSVSIQTEWGTATIARSHILSVTTSTDSLSWQQQAGRWRLAADRPQDGTFENAVDVEESADNADIQLDSPDVIADDSGDSQ